MYIIMDTFSIASMTRGYHVYQGTWNALVGEVLECKRESSNSHDPFAVAVVRNSTGGTAVVVGNVPRRLSALCSLFLRRSGSTITCRITGSRRYSTDLPQGGLEIPSMLTFSGQRQNINKVKALIAEVVQVVVRRMQQVILMWICLDMPAKRPALCSDVWTNLENITLYMEDKQKILGNDLLNDDYINTAQNLLKRQFPSLTGLESTLTVGRTVYDNWVCNYLQFLHCRGNHWITVSTLGCAKGEINIFDSIFSSLDKDILSNIFKNNSLCFKNADVHKQKGVKDCGLFAIAFATHLANGTSPTCVSFDQSSLRTHLVSCISQNVINLFPML